MPDFTIARAEEAALPACFALLPMLAAPEAIIFTARDADGTLAGAGGLLWQSWGEPAGLPAWVHVLPDRRRQGIGRALMAALKAEAIGALGSVWAGRSIADDSEAAAFARACGFIAERRQLFFEADARDFQRQIAPTVDRLRSRGRIPDGARVAALDDAPVDEIGLLVAQEFRSGPLRMAQMLGRAMIADPAEAPIDRLGSRVLMVDGALAGALLSRRTGADAAHIVCNVVAPGWRKGWANALLLEGFTRATIAAGCTRIGFDCRDDVRDTIGLAARSGADHIRTDGLFRYAVADSAD
ncbi:MAG TPA: GNAT family N-acetyltransferase [Sphingomonas sp.]|uniref:GNAT family N-acetyltransferase n=1 Tax=Sphingomonas sp. TaxID=28214 RepID=UPI002BDEED09|nr:GNAT family N-acetyltransferase [Sphingomonas sp.]HMI18155.1 GNAT family N-acetyltransferase [Sphingomonas sp.]